MGVAAYDGKNRDPGPPLATPIFSAASPPTPVEEGRPGFWAAPPIPDTLLPGTQIHLRGPLGRGFGPPPDARRLALAALGENASRLLALVSPSLLGDRSVVLFGDFFEYLPLPAAIEAYPWENLPESLNWADYLALDLSIERFSELDRILGFDAKPRAGPIVEALLETPMPCGGLAACGICTVRLGSKLLLACEEGPVFRIS
jgi:hypothetical protein